MKHFEPVDVNGNGCNPTNCAACRKHMSEPAENVNCRISERGSEPKSLYGAEALTYEFYFPSLVSRA